MPQKYCQMLVRMPLETRRALKIVTAHMNLKKMKTAEGRSYTVTQVVNIILDDYLKKNLYKERAASAEPAAMPTVSITDSKSSDSTDGQ